jgi:hypothetical protein
MESLIILQALRLRQGPRQGARYERHRDGFPHGPDDACGEGPMWRRVTAILYLNDEVSLEQFSAG